MRNFLIILAILAAAVGAYFALGNYLWSDLAEMSETPEVKEGGMAGNISLEGSSWQWERTELHTGEQVEAPSGEGFVLSFEADGQVQSSTDCNHMAGIYSQDGEVLSMGQFAMTKMFCPDSMESVYAEQLGLVSSFSLTGDTMFMNLNRDYGTMIFTRN